MKMVVIYYGGHFLVPETSSDTLLRPCLEPNRDLRLQVMQDEANPSSLYLAQGGLKSCTREEGYLTGCRKEFKLMPELETKEEVN